MQRLRWGIIIGVMVVFIAVTAPRAVRRLQFIYWMKQCRGYVAPPDRVVFDNDPIGARALLGPLGQPLNYRGSTPNGPAFLSPDAYEKLRFPYSSGTAFLHERAPSSSGKRMLLAVDLCPEPNGILLNPLLFATDAMANGAAISTTLSGDGRTIGLQRGDVLRVFAGQPDPNDASHFTIDYLLNGTRHTLDGWLKSDGLVIIESRD